MPFSVYSALSIPLTVCLSTALGERWDFVPVFPVASGCSLLSLCSPLVYARSLKATAYWPRLGLAARATSTSPKMDPRLLNSSSSSAAVAEPKTGGLWTRWTIRPTLALSAQWQCTSAVSGELVRPGADLNNVFVNGPDRRRSSPGEQVGEK